MEAKAIAKYVRMSPIKLKPVTDLVRGKDLNEALNILKFTPGKGAGSQGRASIILKRSSHVGVTLKEKN